MFRFFFQESSTCFLCDMAYFILVGKTSIILPGVIRNDRFNHYIYISGYYINQQILLSKEKGMYIYLFMSIYHETNFCWCHLYILLEVMRMRMRMLMIIIIIRIRIIMIAMMLISVTMIMEALLVLMMLLQRG